MSYHKEVQKGSVVSTSVRGGTRRRSGANAKCISGEPSAAYISRLAWEQACLPAGHGITRLCESYAHNPHASFLSI